MWRRLYRKLRAMLIEGVCDHCGHVLFPELRADSTPLELWYCVHCDRGHSRANCGKCDVMFATAPVDIDGD